MASDKYTGTLASKLVMIAAVVMVTMTANAADLFNNTNVFGVINGPTAATSFTLGLPMQLTELTTYHWNNGRGLPHNTNLTISLQGPNGATFGPFSAQGSCGQNNVCDVNWTAHLNVTVPPGVYTVIDSDPATWSQNVQSQHEGFAIVRGAQAAKPSDIPPATVRSEYAVKFVCGIPVPQFPVVAPGQYFTAINVHNPSFKPVAFRKKVAVALPSERGGPISQFYEARLNPDQALEIDCPDILQLARTQGFLKGFVVIETDSELDVVAVYTAGHPQVETMEVVRVQPRQILPAQVISPVSDTAACPAGGAGAPVGNEGCCCNRPKPGGGSWPDCRAGLTCVGNAAGPGVPTSLYGVCSSTVSANIFISPPPPPQSSQPPFCGQK